ncbi:RadC family protein [Geoalkalibacter halelectricus]|uniref:RadC family protein n=1 Tax=Geoalkalibacter halelectricus TaxID=2847045 RepID=UPI003D22D0DE
MSQDLSKNRKLDQKPVRLKSIRAVYEESPFVCENHSEYLGQKISMSAEVAEIFGFLRQETKEHFICLHLNTKNRIICFDLVSTGSLNAAIVRPREVFKSVLLSNAAAVVFLHNHPSGDPEPSREDSALTRDLKECADFLGIRVLDHIIIGDTRHVSFVDRGLL